MHPEKEQMTDDTPTTPPLSIRLNRDTGLLPGGVSIQFPNDVARALLSRKDVATPVANFDLFPDLILDEDDLKQIGFDPYNPAVAAQ